MGSEFKIHWVWGKFLVCLEERHRGRNWAEKYESEEFFFRASILLFLYPSSCDFDNGQFGLGSMEGDSEIQYVVATNGVSLESRKNSIGLASTSDNNLDELLNLNVKMETGRVAT